MNIFKVARNGVLGIGFAWLGASALVGCSAGGDSSSPAEESGAASAHPLAAGKVGKSVGVARWTLDDTGIVQALDAGDKVIGKFRFLEERGGIVSLTGKGERHFDASGAITTDTLSDVERELVAAVREDMIAESEAFQAAAKEPGAQKALEWIAFACCSGSESGTLHQWWSGGWTQYCAVRPIPGTTCDQNQIPQCFNLGYARGCSIWM
jgi:hypothetical protein